MHPIYYNSLLVQQSYERENKDILINRLRLFNSKSNKKKRITDTQRINI